MMCCRRRTLLWGQNNVLLPQNNRTMFCGHINVLWPLNSSSVATKHSSGRLLRGHKPICRSQKLIVHGIITWFFKRRCSRAEHVPHPLEKLYLDQDDIFWPLCLSPPVDWGRLNMCVCVYLWVDLTLLGLT